MTIISEAFTRARPYMPCAFDEDYGDAVVAILQAFSDDLQWQMREEENASLRSLLKEAMEALDEERELVAFWAAYASPYFREKHDLAGDLAGIDETLAKLAEVVK